MKKLLYFIIGSLAFFACSEDEIRTYDAENFIYFSNRINPADGSAIWDSMKEYNFFFEMGVEERIFEIQVTAGGAIVDRDRVFRIGVESEGGVEGVDFDVAREHIMPAGEIYAFIPITLYKTPELEGQTYSLIINLLPSDDFSLKLSPVFNRTDTIDRTRMRLDYRAELSAPPFWTQQKNMIGYFSVAKYNEINNLVGFTLEDWLAAGTAGAVVSGQMTNWLAAFSNHLNYQISLGPDEAIKDMHPESDRGYMTFPGFPAMNIPGAIIPADWPTVPGWVGPQ